MKTRRLTTAQALVRFLVNQHSRRDGVTRRFIPKVLGIFGHGNVAGLGEALQAAGSDLPYVPGRNEQALVHAAAAFAKMTNDSLRTYHESTCQQMAIFSQKIKNVDQGAAQSY